MTEDSSNRKQGVDKNRRRFLSAATTVMGGVGIGFASVPFFSSFQPSAKAKAIGAPIEMDISKLEPGQRIIGKWQGKPVWIVRRSDAVVTALEGLNELLRDPDSKEPQQPDYARNTYRSIKQEYLVVVGVCTHFGCSPLYLPVGEYNAEVKDNKGGFFCPCHGSRFDMAGRVYQGVPAPTNLVVPPHQFLSGSRLLIGADDVQESS